MWHDSSYMVALLSTAPTVVINNTYGCQLYLSKGSLDASITIVKPSEINMLAPVASDEADLIEHSLLEKFNHRPLLNILPFVFLAGIR